MTAAPWSKVAVGELLAHPLRNGISPSNKGTVTAEVLTLSAVTGPRFDPSARKTAQFESEHAQGKTVRRADLLICRGNGNIGLVGRARRPRADMPDVAFPDTMIGASFDLDRVDLTFLEYLWDSQVVRGQVEEMARSTNGTHKINQGMVESIEIPLPPIDEQRRIASVLDAADELRGKRREALARLDTLTQAIFMSMFGDPVSNTRGWPSAPLGDVTTKIGSGATPRGGKAAYRDEGIPLIRSMNVHDSRFEREGLAYLDDEQAWRLRNAKVEPGDVLLNITGASVARVCLAPDSLEGARVNQHVAIIRPNPERVNATFLSQALVSRSSKARLLRIAESGATRQAITKAELERLVVGVPPVELQEAFQRAVVRVVTTEEAAGLSAKALDDLFASLRQKAFRGEL